MSKTEHSPLPWCEHLVDEVQVVSRVGEGEEVCAASGDYDHDYERMYANTRFIVTACNSYYDNQKAIAELVEQLDIIKDWCWACDGSGKVGLNNCYTCSKPRTLIAKHKAVK